MTVENTESFPDDLDAFDQLLNEGEASDQKQEDPIEDDDDTPEDDTPATDDASDEDELVDNPEEDDSKLKIRKKLTARESIEQLNAEKHEARREAEALKAELERYKQPTNEPKQVEGTAKEPDPDAEVDGEPVYPLGKFDPKYISDLADFKVATRLAEFEAANKRAAEEAEKRRVTEALDAEWQQRLEQTVAENPDFLQSAQKLETAFEGVDEEYAVYIATALKSMENGPDVILYLSQNLEEAKKILRSGPVAATLALGGINALVQKRGDAPKKVTAAPEPPPRTRGTGGKFSVSPDTDDLDAFSDMFFQKAK